MGFNVQACGIDDVFGEDAPFAALLRARFGPDVPLGAPGSEFVIADEMAWSWWSELQQFAREQLGEDGSQHVRAVDAWCGVYLDVPVVRELIWPPGVSPGASPAASAVVVGSTGSPAPAGGVLGWVMRVLGLSRPRVTTGQDDSEASRAIQAMVEQYGARRGESGSLQVGGLRGLMGELDRLLEGLQVERTEAAVESLRRRYDDPARCDDDGHIQCLCHAWLTGRQALRLRTPLWFVK